MKYTVVQVVTKEELTHSTSNVVRHKLSMMLDMLLDRNLSIESIGFKQRYDVNGGFLELTGFGDYVT